jgi:hypothetical protein
VPYDHLLTCNGCGATVSAADVRYQPGPGADMKVKARHRRPARAR